MTTIYELFCFNKNTPKKVRWSTSVEGITFYLYIPRPAIPIPFPEMVKLKVIHDPDEKKYYFLQLSEYRGGGTFFFDLVFHSEHTETYRYNPESESDRLQIGDVYIPKPLLPSDAPRKITVLGVWDSSAFII